MSWQASKHVWNNSKQTGGLKLTLLAIADYASPRNNWTCTAAIETLAQMVGVSDRQIKKNLKTLEGVGELLIDRQSGRGNTNTYSLLPLIKGELQFTLNDTEKVNSGTKKVNSRVIKGELQDTRSNITNNNQTHTPHEAPPMHSGTRYESYPNGKALEYEHRLEELDAAIATVCKMELLLNQDKIRLLSIALEASNYTPEQILCYFGDESGYWYQSSFGRNGEVPKLGNIRGEILAASDWQPGKPHKNGTGPNKQQTLENIQSAISAGISSRDYQTAISKLSDNELRVFKSLGKWGDIKRMGSDEIRIKVYQGMKA